MKNRKTKILFCGVLVLIGLFFAGTPVNAAASSTGPVTVSATVPSSLELVVSIADGLTNATVPSMNFGELIPDTGDYRAKTFFIVQLRISAGGSPHELTQNGTLLTRNGGGDTIPDGSYIVKPSYNDSVNGGDPQPSGSQMGLIGSAVGNRLLYRDPIGKNRTITANYTLSGDSNTGATQTIPLSQKAGPYAGNIQFTLTTT